MFIEQTFKKSFNKTVKVFPNTKTSVFYYEVKTMGNFGMKQRYSLNDQILNHLTPKRTNSKYFDEMLVMIQKAAKRIIEEKCCNAESISKLNFLDALYELIEQSQQEELFLASTARDAFYRYIMSHEKSPEIVFEAFARFGY